MVEQTTLVRIKVGQIYILSNNQFSLVCEFCTHGFYNSEDLLEHLTEHFPDSAPTIKNENIINCASDCESLLSIGSEESLIDNLQDDTAESLSTEGSVAPTLNGTCHKDQPSRNHELQSNISIENKETAEPAELNGEHTKRSLIQMEKRTEKSVLMPKDTNLTGPSYLNIIESHPDNVMEIPNSRKRKLKFKTNFKCIFCRKIFHKKEDLLKHENTHIGKSHKCHICSKPFAASGLRRHILTHTRSVRIRLERLGLITEEEQIICLENTFRAYYSISKTPKNNLIIKK